MTNERAQTELADRCEKATGPDWSLDCDIALARGYYIPSPPTGGGLAIPSGAVPRYTASLDAAMTLVPEVVAVLGDHWKVEAYTESGVRSDQVRASAWVAGAPRVYAATPALALCAAALRARSQ